MENNRNRGNFGNSENNSRGYSNRGAKPYQNNGGNYHRNGGQNNNYGNRRSYNQDGNVDNYGRGYNRNNGNGRYDQNSNGYRSNDNYGRGRYNDNNGRNNGGYNRYDRQNDGNGNYSRQGNKYTVDEKGFHHKKYWDHSDRKKQAIEDAMEREDDILENDGKIRLNKYLANSGMCSRREADRMIKAGMVEVNGEVVTEMGVKVNVSDEVKYNGMVIKPERKRYIILNKPKDFITTLKDPNARNTVMDLIDGACKERVYPVGRLDRNTTGVLLFTNDGDLAKKLTHPSNEIQKVYHVTTSKPVNGPDIDKIAEGFELEDGFISADEVGYLDERNKCEIGIRIHSGRNRIVRRIFEHLGYEVQKLDRVFFAGIDKRGLARGHWRFLTDKEVGFLKMISSKAPSTEDKDTEQ
jgi:23S rRNA pseudouridine2605 synthase